MEGRIDAEMQLETARLEPDATTPLQVGRLGDLFQAEQGAVERPRPRFAIRRDGDLDMMDACSRAHAYSLIPNAYARRTVHRNTDRAVAAVRKLQKDPELGEFRAYAALRQLGIHLSPRTTASSSRSRSSSVNACQLWR